MTLDTRDLYTMNSYYNILYIKWIISYVFLILNIKISWTELIITNKLIIPSHKLANIYLQYLNTNFSDGALMWRFVVVSVTSV